MIKTITFILFLIVPSLSMGQTVSNLINTSGPFTNEISSFINYNDSIIYIVKKEIGFFKSDDLGNSWIELKPQVIVNDFFTSIVRHTNGDLFAGTTQSGILRSTDQGNSWIQTQSNQYSGINFLFTKSNGYLFAITDDQQLIRSTNLGSNWHHLFFNFPSSTITESISGTLFMIQSEKIYRSTDNGIHWTEPFWLGTMENDDYLTADSFNAVYYGGFRYMYRTLNQGLSWQQMNYGYLGNKYTSFGITSDSIIFAGFGDSGSFGGILRSTNYGISFAHYALYQYEQVIQKMFIYDDEYLFVSLKDGLLKNNFRINNYFTRVDQTIQSPKITNFISPLYSHAVIAVCDSEGVYSYLNGHWQKQFINFPVVAGITAGCITEGFQILGTGDKGLWKSINNGGNWTQLDIFPHINSSIVSVKNIQSSLLFTATKYDGIYVSTNSGINWQSSGSGLPGAFTVEDMDVSSNGVCYISLLNEGVYFSLDSCKTWYSRSNGLPNNSSIKSLSERANCILGVTDSNEIYLTTDFGANWNKVMNGLPGTLLNSVVKYHSSGIAFLASGRNIYRSNDFGVNWFLNYSVPYGVNILSLSFDTYSVLYVGCDNGIVFKSVFTIIPVELISFDHTFVNNKVNLLWSTASELNNRGFEIERSTNKTDLPDGKAGWRIIGFKEGNGTTTETHNYSFVDDLFGTSSQKLFYRLKQIDFDGSFEYSDIVEVNIAPLSFSLSQNYPNPFNPTTKIKYSIPTVETHRDASLLVTLKIYDVLGSEVATLVNEEKHPGVYEPEFDGSQLASGIYYYQLKVGEYAETKKMIFMK